MKGLQQPPSGIAVCHWITVCHWVSAPKRFTSQQNSGQALLCVQGMCILIVLKSTFSYVPRLDDILEIDAVSLLKCYGYMYSVAKQKSPSAYNMFPANSQKSCSTSASSLVSPSSSSWTAFLLFLSLSSDSSLSLSLFLSLSRSSSLGRFRGSRTRGDVLRGVGLSERWPCVWGRGEGVGGYGP